MSKLPAANGKFAVGGFCWGGSQTLRYATNNPNLKAAFVFMDQARRAKTIWQKSKRRSRAFTPATMRASTQRSRRPIEMMKELGKKYEPVTYEGAGHGFMRAGDAPEPTAPQPKGDQATDQKATEDYQKALTAYKANKKARDEA